MIKEEHKDWIVFSTRFRNTRADDIRRLARWKKCKPNGLIVRLLNQAIDHEINAMVEAKREERRLAVPPPWWPNGGNS